MQLNIKKGNNPIKKLAEDLNRHFSKENITGGQQPHEKMLNITHHQENASQNTMRYHLTPVRMAIIKMTTNNKCS